MRTLICLAALAVALGHSSVAWAASELEGELFEESTPTFMGDAFFGLGGGAFNQDLGKLSDGGFAFNARVGVDGTGILRFTGAELAYQGLRADAGPQREYLYGGVLGLNLRGNVPITVGSRLLKPYVIGGVGWSRISVSRDFSGTVGTSSTLPLALDGDNALAVPLGAGVSYFFQNGVGVDGRFVYNILVGERAPLVQSGDSWSVGVNAGGHWGW